MAEQKNLSLSRPDACGSDSRDMSLKEISEKVPVRDLSRNHVTVGDALCIST